MKKTIVIAALACTAMAATASAQSITTLFAANNSGGLGGGVYFNITTGANPIEITGFDVNSSALPGAAIAFEAYTHANGWDGFHNSPVGWTQVATGSGTTAGRDIPSAVTLRGSFVIPANTTLGMALTLGASAGHAYTNGAGGQAQTFMDPNVTLVLGGATNSLFGAGRFFPRVWNGTIYYTVVPAPASLALLGLGGLVAVRRRR